MQALKARMMRLCRFLFAIGVAFVSAMPAQAITLGVTPPTIIVRQAPSKPISSIYVIFVGSLAEMLTAEEAVAKFFEKSDVTVIGASLDISEIDQLKSLEVANRVAARLEAVGGQVGMLRTRVSKISGNEITFSMTLTAVGTGELAVGEVLIDTDNQLSFSSSDAQSLRIATRDAIRRFLADSRIGPMFAK